MYPKYKTQYFDFLINENKDELLTHCKLKIITSKISPIEFKVTKTIKKQKLSVKVLRRTERWYCIKIALLQRLPLFKNFIQAFDHFAPKKADLFKMFHEKRGRPRKQVLQKL